MASSSSSSSSSAAAAAAASASAAAEATEEQARMASLLGNNACETPLNFVAVTEVTCPNGSTVVVHLRNSQQDRPETVSLPTATHVRNDAGAHRLSDAMRTLIRFASQHKPQQQGVAGAAAAAAGAAQQQQQQQQQQRQQQFPPVYIIPSSRIQSIEGYNPVKVAQALGRSMLPDISAESLRPTLVSIEIRTEAGEWEGENPNEAALSQLPRDSSSKPLGFMVVELPCAHDDGDIILAPKPGHNRKVGVSFSANMLPCWVNSSSGSYRYYDPSKTLVAKELKSLRAFAYLSGCASKAKRVTSGVYLAATYALYGRPRVYSAAVNDLVRQTRLCILSPPEEGAIIDAETATMISQLREQSAANSGAGAAEAAAGGAAARANGVRGKRGNDDADSDSDSADSDSADHDHEADDDAGKKKKKMMMMKKKATTTSKAGKEKKTKKKAKRGHDDGSDFSDDDTSDIASSDGELKVLSQDTLQVVESMMRWSLEDLRRHCREEGLSAKGNKALLVERLTGVTELDLRDQVFVQAAEDAMENIEFYSTDEASTMAADFATAVIKAMSNKSFLADGGKIGFACMHLYAQEVLPCEEVVPLTAACDEVKLQGSDAIVAVTLARMGFLGELLCVCVICFCV